MNLIQAYDALGALTWDDKVAILAARLKALESQVTPPFVPVEHRYEPGFYIRTMYLPADMIFIGRKHLRGHEVHLIKGRATYITPKGKFDCSAPFSIFTAPGFAMVAYIQEECVVETWHTNEEESRDSDMLEARDFELPEVTLARGQKLLEVA